MKVILFEAVDALGRPGDIVEVKPGFYRNFLGPRGFAEVATEGNLKRLASKRRILEAQAASELEAAQARAKELAGLSISFSMRADDRNHLFGSVGVADIARALAEKEIEIARRDVLIPAPLKQLGEHKVELRLHPEVTTEISVVIERQED